MSEKKFIFISNGQIHLTPKDVYNISDTTFPPESISLKRNIDTYWEIEGKYLSGETKVILQVKDYFPTDTASFQEQTLTQKVTIIAFEKLDSDHLYKIAGSYMPGRLQPFLAFKEKKTDEQNDMTMPKLPKRSKATMGLPAVDYTYQPFPLTGVQDVELGVDVPFELADFSDGYVGFWASFVLYAPNIYFKISNPYIIHEFNYVKGYFAKALGGRKTFHATVKITLNKGQLTHSSALSAEIDLINEDLIDRIKRKRVLQLAAVTIEPGSETFLFDCKEAFPIAIDEINKDPFLPSATEMITTIIDARNPRNRKQLEYLAGEKQNAQSKIYFTVKPLFGFLFFIRGDQYDYYCWELLQSHATYLWKFDREDSTNAFKRMNQAIQTIHDIGRDNYKKLYKKGEIDPDLTFITIDHLNIQINTEHSFEFWKGKLNEIVK